MPIVIVKGNVATGQVFDATLADGDRRLPVRVRRLNERTLLLVPDDPSDIVSTVVQDNVTTFGIGPGRRNTIVDSVRHARLAKASQCITGFKEVKQFQISGLAACPCRASGNSGFDGAGSDRFGYPRRNVARATNFLAAAEGLYDKARSDRIPYDLWHAQGYLQTRQEARCRTNTSRSTSERSLISTVLPSLV
jgi:hypothetical protein